MVKKITLLSLSALFATQVVFAETSSNWIEVTTNKDGAFLVKKGTFRNVKGDSSALFMYEKTDKKLNITKLVSKTQIVIMDMVK